MTLPRFWRRASFSVDETAEIIGVSSDCLRGWLARLPTNDFAGLKQDGRIWLSGQDAFFFLLVATLTVWGIPVRDAFREAGKLVEDLDDGIDESTYIAVTSRAGEWHFEPWALEEYGPTPTLIIPMHELYSQHIEQCARIDKPRAWRTAVVRDLAAGAADRARRHREARR